MNKRAMPPHGSFLLQKELMYAILNEEKEGMLWEKRY